MILSSLQIFRNNQTLYKTILNRHRMRARKMINEFPERNWKLSLLNKLIAL